MLRIPQASVPQPGSCVLLHESDERNRTLRGRDACNGGIRPDWSEKCRVETLLGSGHHFQDIRQRGPIQYLRHRALHLTEDTAHVAPAFPATRPQVIETAMELDRSLQGLDDLTQRDASRRPRQTEPTPE